MGGKVVIGTLASYLSFQNTISGSAVFINSITILGNINNNSIRMNEPKSTTGCLIIKDSGGLNSSLIIESSKGTYISQFGMGLGGNVDIRSALVSGFNSRHGWDLLNWHEYSIYNVSDNNRRKYLLGWLRSGYQRFKRFR